VLILQTPSKRPRRHAQNTDYSYEATADETSFDADDNAEGDNSDVRGNDSAMLDSYVTELLSDMGNEMFRSEHEIARVREIDVPEYKYNSEETCNEVHVRVFRFLLLLELCDSVRVVPQLASDSRY